MPSKRRSRKKRINYDIDKRKLRKKLKKKPVIQCKQMNDVWDKKKTIQQNLAEMGLSFDTNKTMSLRKCTPTIIADDVHVAEQKPVKIPEVIESMETEVELGEKEKRFLVSSEDVLFCTHMMDKHNENYKVMSRDKRNHYQLTPKQIRNKIRSFKRSKQQYKKYLDKKAKEKQSGGETEKMES